MCNQYTTVQSPERMLEKFGSVLPSGLWERDIYSSYEAPVIRRIQSGAQREAIRARFGLVPRFAPSERIKYSTMNAKSETVASKDAFKLPYKQRQWCIVPAEAFYEPYYDIDRWNAGVHRSERYGIRRVDDEPIGIAGLWEAWTPKHGGGEPIYSFTMLTINADEHPLLKRFHMPFDDDGKPKEKRTVVLLQEQSFDAWLDATHDDFAGFLSTFNEAELLAYPAPAPAKKVAPTKPSQLQLKLDM